MPFEYTPPEVAEALAQLVRARTQEDSESRSKSRWSFTRRRSLSRGTRARRKRVQGGEEEERRQKETGRRREAWMGGKGE